MENLTDQLVIVTGVSKGIGRAIVMALLGQGAKVAGWGRSAPPIEHSHFHFFKTDISDEQQVMASYQETTHLLGTDIAGLINNAGIGYRGPIETTTAQEWLRMFEVNVHGLFYCSKAVIPQMKANGEGHIVNIASVAAHTAVPQMAGYCGTKHAVRGISHTMFQELRSFGIKVSCVMPGSVNTHFFDDIDAIEAHDNMMKPEDIANTVIHVLKSPPNYHILDVEARPLNPKN